MKDDVTTTDFLPSLQTLVLTVVSESPDLCELRQAGCLCFFFLKKKVIELILLMHSILNDGVAMEMSAGLVKEDPRVTKARVFLKIILF